MSVLHKIHKMRAAFRYRHQVRELVSSYLFFIENPDKSAWGSITSEDEKGIEMAVNLAGRDYGPIIEIGTLFGHTTNLLATLKPAEVPLITVENFSWNPFCLPAAAHRQITHRTLRYVMDHCCTRIFEGSASEFYATYQDLRPRLVFIDAGHSYSSVKSDIEWALSIGCPTVAGHDYVPMHPGVVKAVDEAFRNDITVFGSVWIHHSANQSGIVKGEEV